MIGGKRKKEQSDLVITISDLFPEDFSWYDLISVLDQIIDRMEVNFINISPRYIEELVYFYGAKRPSLTIKKDFIKFITDSQLNEFINIENEDELIITVIPGIEALYDKKIINPRWLQLNNNLKEKLRHLKSLKRTPGENEKIKNTRKQRNELTKTIPKKISKSKKQLKKDKREIYEFIKLVQNVISGFLLKYPDLIDAFLKSLKNIIGKDEEISNSEGINLTRLPFNPNSFEMSPREAAYKEISEGIRLSDNTIQFSGVKPFTLEKISSKNKRLEVDWWVNRFEDKKKGSYPNETEKTWIYQYY